MLPSFSSKSICRYIGIQIDPLSSKRHLNKRAIHGSGMAWDGMKKAADCRILSIPKKSLGIDIHIVLNPL
jgi:hypothetical protein